MLRPFTHAVLLGFVLVGCAQEGPTDVGPKDLAPSYSTQATPFRGSITTVENDVFAPPNLLATGTAEGSATQLGRFTATFSAVIDLATKTSTGTFTFTAANGDLLFATFIGLGVEVEPGLERLTEVATIVGGTGRFTTATGTFTLVRLLIIDLGGGPAHADGSFAGHINLNR